jgi:SAM-dependent methyltransferase
VRLRAEGDQLRRSLRERAIRRVLAELGPLDFERGLEIGAGDGTESTVLAPLTGLLVATEYRTGWLVRPRAANVRFAVADAEALPFAAASFDLVFSSHVLEHLPDLPRALAEMRRVLRPAGRMVHVVPTRFWKLLDLALFYPSQAVHVLETCVFGRGARPPARTSDGRRSNPKLRPTGWLRRSLWPPVHGVSASNLEELRAFGRQAWRECFVAAGFEVVRMIDRLPAHSPYRFGWERTRRLVEAVGLSSSVGFVLAGR